MKPSIPNRFFLLVGIAAALALISSQAMSEDYGFEEPLFVIGSSVSVRMEPREGARIAGKLPIGAKLTYLGTAKKLTSLPSNHRPIESEDSQLESCPAPEKADSEQWICVRSDLVVDDFGHYWGGWVSSELLGKHAPQFAELIEKYQSTATANTSERRKWAERATALDPLNPVAQQNLLSVLKDVGDQTTISVAERSFAAYQNPQTSPSNRKLIFSVTNGLMEPIGEVSNGKFVSPGFSQKTNYEFRKRGQMYGLYRSGTQIGWVVTESQFDCMIKTCPTNVVVRTFPDRDLQGAIAINFSLPPRKSEASSITPEQKKLLAAFAEKWIKSNLSGKARKAVLEKIQLEEASFGAGALQNGKGVLFANWVVGSMNDQHYGDPDDVYESLLIIAEQQQDGTFRPAHGSGSITENGCVYFDNGDFDSDGIDEIILRCDQLEGSYNYGVMKRVKGVWTRM